MIRILIADDYLPFRIMLRYLLDDEPDFEVVGEAPDGVVAVRLAEELQPDVIMLDLAMPNLDGWEAIPILRTVAPGTQIVVLSGFPLTRLRDASLHEHIARYLEKGEPAEVLCSAVREAVSLQAA